MVTSITTEKTIVASLGEIKVSSDPDVILQCLGLGSCIAVIMYDPVAKVGGLAHVVLPQSNDSSQARVNGIKYADIAIPELLQQMRAQGAVRSRMATKIVGGSRMFKVSSNAFDTGERNIEAVKKVLAEEGMRISGEDTGGKKGRSVQMHVDSGKVEVRCVGSPAREI